MFYVKTIDCIKLNLTPSKTHHTRIKIWTFLADTYSENVSLFLRKRLKNVDILCLQIFVKYIYFKKNSVPPPNTATSEKQ